MKAVRDQLRSILAPVLKDPKTLQAAVDAVAAGPDPGDETAVVDGAAVDLGRAARCGFPEVVFGEGKSPELMVQILKQQQDAGQRSLVTRLCADHAQILQSAFPDAAYDPIARTLIRPDIANNDSSQTKPVVAVVSAGSCDAAVAREAMSTLRWMEVAAELVEDVGVAGPQRLLTHLPLLQSVRAVVCVAGMEAALPSVVGGHVGCPVIGVPTSVGYGASFGGLTALLSMLTCCASNVVAVNIDAGFRGGYVAGMIAKESA